MTPRDRAGDRTGHRTGSREAAGDAGHRQGFPTPPPIRPLPGRLPDRNGGFPRLSDGPMLLDGAQGLRCLASPRHALLAESLGEPSLWVNIKDLWYHRRSLRGRGVTTLLTRSFPNMAGTHPIAWRAAGKGEGQNPVVCIRSRP